MKEKIVLRTIGRFKVYMALTFNSKIIEMILDFYSNPHTIGNDCVKYEHPGSTIKRGVSVSSCMQAYSIGH